jgi:hypothetical protein
MCRTQECFDKSDSELEPGTLTAMAAQVLSRRTLNRTVLHRQLLLQRANLGVVPAIERTGGLQTQYAPSGYIALWSRLQHFQRPTLTRALEQGRVVQAWMMRATIHMASAADFRLFTAGVRRHRRQWWERVARRELEGVDMTAVGAFVREQLAAGPRRQTELATALADAGFPKIAWQGVGTYLDLVRVPPSGTWERRRADLYALAEDWVGPIDQDEDQGITHLITRYLSGFGPAPLRSAAGWAGIPAAAVQAVAERMTLRRFVDEEGEELVDLPRRPIVDESAQAPVRFLPTWEALLLAHARHGGFLAEEYRDQVFNTKMPQSIPTFLVDGTVAGTWRSEGGRVVVTPFDTLPRRWRRAVDEEAAALDGWLEGTL